MKAIREIRTCSNRLYLRNGSGLSSPGRLITNPSATSRNCRQYPRKRTTRFVGIPMGDDEVGNAGGFLQSNAGADSARDASTHGAKEELELRVKRGRKSCRRKSRNVNRPRLRCAGRKRRQRKPAGEERISRHMSHEIRTPAERRHGMTIWRSRRGLLQSTRIPGNREDVGRFLGLA